MNVSNRGRRGTYSRSTLPKLVTLHLQGEGNNFGLLEP